MMRVVVTVVAAGLLQNVARAEPEFMRRAPGQPVKLVAIEDDSGTLRDIENSEPTMASLYAFKEFVETHYDALDLASGSDHLEFGVRGESESETDVPAGEIQFDTRVTSIRQYVGGIEVADGNISVGFHHNRIAVVQGQVFSASHIAATLGAVIGAPVVSYASARSTAKTGCAEFYELAPEKPYLSVRDGRKHYRFICDIDEVQIDAVTGFVAARFRAANLWTQTTQSMSAAADGSRVSGVTGSQDAWIRYQDGNSPLLVQTLGGVRTQFEIVKPDECRFRLEVAWPFPTTFRDNIGVAGPFQREGPCFGGAFVEPDITRPLFHLSNVHSQIERMAHIAKLDPEAGLFSVQRAVEAPDPDRLLVEVGVDPGPLFCWGQPGIYFSWGEVICLRTDNYYASWGTTVHEFGHYLMDMYGAASTLFQGCDADAIAEGGADALMVSLMHRRYSQMSAITDAQRVTLFKNGPGNLRNDGGNSPDYRPFPIPRSSSLQECDNSYIKGMALGQVMWQLVNGLHCESFAACNSPVEIIYQAQKRDLLPRAARRGFTLAITNNDADDVHMLLRAWKTWTVRLLADSNALDTWSRSQVMFAFMVVDS